MANCPKCGEHLRLIDWKQHCPHCGANIVIYDLQERLMQDADVAEVQFYHFQKKIDNLKASFVGTKLSIVRIVTSILPLVAVLLPLLMLRVKDYFIGGLDVFGIIDNIDNFNEDFINALLGTPEALPLVISVVCFVLSVVMLLVHLILLILACSPKAKKRGFIINGLMLFFTLVFVIAPLFATHTGPVNGTTGIGAVLYLVLMIVNSAVDIIVLIKGTSVTHKQCYVGGIPIEEYFEMLDKGMTTEEIRKEQYKRLTALQLEQEAEIKRKNEEKEKELKAKEEAKN